MGVLGGEVRLVDGIKLASRVRWANGRASGQGTAYSNSVHNLQGYPVTRDEEVVRRVREFQRGKHREENSRWLFETFSPAVIRLFSRWGCSADESADLTQDTFWKAFRSLRQFRHGSRFETWLFKIARNRWMNQVRSRATRKRDAEIGSLDADESGSERLLLDTSDLNPEEQTLENERQRLQRQALYTAVERFPPQMRRCCYLRYGHGKKYREIAVVLGVSMNTVKALLSEAKKRLRRMAR